MASSFDSDLETPRFDSIANLAENVVYRVPGCADLMVRKCIREAARDFCRRSCCLRATRRILLEPGVLRYPVEPVYGGVVERVDRVLVSLRLRPLVQNRDFRLVDGTPASIVLRRDQYAEGRDENWLEVSTVELPEMEGERLPAWLVQKHGDAVVAGVLHRLHNMLNRPWSDAQQASKELLAYENAVGFAAADYAGGSQFGNTVADDPLAAALL